MQKQHDRVIPNKGRNTLPPEYTAVELYVTYGGTQEPDIQRLCPLLLSSGLSRTTLAQLWEVANRKVPGQLSVPELYTLLALVALAQQRKPLTDVGKGHFPIPKLDFPTTTAPPSLKMVNQGLADDEFDDFKSAAHAADDDFSEFQQALPSLPTISQGSSDSSIPSFYNPRDTPKSAPSVISSVSSSWYSNPTTLSPYSSSSYSSSFTTLSNSLSGENKTTVYSFPHIPLSKSDPLSSLASPVQQPSLFVGSSDASSNLNKLVQPNQVLIETQSLNPKPGNYRKDIPHGMKLVQPSLTVQQSGSSVTRPQQAFTLPSPQQKPKKIFPLLAQNKRLNINNQASFNFESISSNFQNDDKAVSSSLIDLSALTSNLTASAASVPKTVSFDKLSNIESDFSNKPDVAQSHFQPIPSPLTTFMFFDKSSEKIQIAPPKDPNATKDPSNMIQQATIDKPHSTMLMPKPATEDKYSCFRELDIQSGISSWSLSQESSLKGLSNTKIEDEDEFGDFVGATSLPKDSSEAPQLVTSNLLTKSEKHHHTLNNGIPGSFDNLTIAESNDDFSDFQSCHSSTDFCKSDPLRLPITSDPTFYSFEAFPSNNSKSHTNAFKQQECQSVSSLELDFPFSEAFADLASSSEQQKPSPFEGLHRQGSLPSLDFKVALNSPSLERAGSPTSLDLRQPRSPSPFDTIQLQRGTSSTQLSPLSNESSAAKLSSDDDISSSLQPAQPALEDRYKFIRLEVEREEAHLAEEHVDRHLREWTKCLTSCHKLLDEACSIFSSISSPKVCREVLSSDKGVKYITNLGEVCKVVERVAVALQSSGKQDPSLQSVLQSAQSAWDSLATLVDSSLLPLPPSIPATTLEDDATVACGVCLLRVEDSLLWYGGRQYHAGCANLWVNCVEPILPSLPIP